MTSCVSHHQGRTNRGGWGGHPGLMSRGETDTELVRGKLVLLPCAMERMVGSVSREPRPTQQHATRVGRL